jgi:hypothetical protein
VDTAPPTANALRYSPASPPTGTAAPRYTRPTTRWNPGHRFRTRDENCTGPISSAVADAKMWAAIASGRLPKLSRNAGGKFSAPAPNPYTPIAYAATRALSKIMTTKNPCASPHPDFVEADIPACKLVAMSPDWPSRSKEILYRLHHNGNTTETA